MRRQRYEVRRADLPLSCPLPSMALWNSHPRVYLAIEAEGGESQCPYCGAHFVLDRLTTRRRRPRACARERPLTVVQLLPALESGGVERSTLEIADALVRAGHRAIVVSAGGRLLPRLLATGAEHVTLDIGRKSPLDACATCRALRALFAREQRRHRACAFAPAGLAGAGARCAGMPAARGRASSPPCTASIRPRATAR